jgi:hypothetical protein
MGVKTCLSLNEFSKSCCSISLGARFRQFFLLKQLCVDADLFHFRWVNRKDADGNNIFEGGFLGLDNIGAFNRSEPLPTGGTLRQADGTAWMAFYCLNMLSIALELAKHNPVYEDIASKFFEVRITKNHLTPKVNLKFYLLKYSISFLSQTQ